MQTMKRFALLLCVVLFLGGVVASLRSITQVRPVMADLSALPVIIIDAGHPDASKHHNHVLTLHHCYDLF